MNLNGNIEEHDRNQGSYGTLCPLIFPALCKQPPAQQCSAGKEGKRLTRTLHLQLP